MRTGVYCGTAVLAAFTMGILLSGIPVLAYFAGFLLPLVAGVAGVCFEDKS